MKTIKPNYLIYNGLEPEILVRPIRFELMAFCFGGKRSIQAELRAQSYKKSILNT